MASSDLNDEQLSACVAFCSTAGLQDGDLGLAQFYLEESGWKVHTALQTYRKAQDNAKKIEQTDKQTSSPGHPSGASLEHPGGPSSTQSSTQSTTIASNPSLEGPSSSNQPSQNKFRLITWNINGLDSQEHTLQERTLAVCDAVKLYAPDVIYLQEVIPLSCALICSALPDYKLIQGGEREYFTVVLLKTSSVVHLSDDTTPFPGSVMLRKLQIVQVKLCCVDLTLMCSHLESTKNFAAERVNQLKSVFEQMKAVSTSRAVIFGGDLNLRDPEVTKAGGLPCGISDIWQLCGGHNDAKFTWDTAVNDNLGLTFAAKCRFDRLYLRQGISSGMKLVPERFSLIGKKRLPGCRRFPSDHWGIVCDFKVERKT